MSEQVQPLSARDIVYSAERLSAVSSFATGESPSMFEAARLMPEYRDLVLAYGRFSIDALRDRRVAAFLQDPHGNQVYLARGESPFRPISVLLLEKGEQYQARFQTYTHFVDFGIKGDEAIEERKAGFEEATRRDFTPADKKQEEPEWDFKYRYVTPPSYDPKTEGDNLKVCIAERDLDPGDFISHPELFLSFVRKINKEMKRASETILPNNSESIEDVNLKARELVIALRKANEILGKAIS